MGNALSGQDALKERRPRVSRKSGQHIAFRPDASSAFGWRSDQVNNFRRWPVGTILRAQHKNPSHNHPSNKPHKYSHIHKSDGRSS